MRASSRTTGKAISALSKADVETRLASFLAKFEPAIADRIRACRTALRAIFPTAVEVVYDNYNFFVIGYSSTGRPSDSIVSLAAASNGVGLSFYHGSTLPDPDHCSWAAASRTASSACPL